MYTFLTAGEPGTACPAESFTEMVAEGRELGEVGRKSVPRVINPGPHFKPSLYQTAKLMMVLSLEDEIAQFISLNAS